MNYISIYVVIYIYNYQKVDSKEKVENKGKIISQNIL